MLELLNFIHLLSIVVWLGMLIFFTFLAAPSIFKVLPKETAGDVVGSIFPKYWITGYVTSVLATATLIATASLQAAWPGWRLPVLIAMTAISFYSGLVIGVKARGIKAKIRADSDDKEALRRDFKRVHAVSAILNITVIILGIILVFLTSAALSR